MLASSGCNTSTKEGMLVLEFLKDMAAALSWGLSLGFTITLPG